MKSPKYKMHTYISFLRNLDSGTVQYLCYQIMIFSKTI